MPIKKHFSGWLQRQRIAIYLISGAFLGFFLFFPAMVVILTETDAPYSVIFTQEFFLPGLFFIFLGAFFGLVLATKDEAIFREKNRQKKESSKRKKSEEDLKLERSRFNTLTANLPSGLSIVSSDYRIKFMNKKMLQRFGNQTGKVCYRIYREKEAPCRDCPSQRAIKNLQAEHSEFRGLDGKDYELIASPLKNPDGSHSAVELIYDITERKKNEADFKNMFLEAITSLSQALDARDHYTEDHSQRMSHLANLTCDRLPLAEKQKEDIHLAALLHDIGKISIKDGILNKPGPLTDEEFNEIKQHPLMSEEILKPIKELGETLKIIRHHHERFDGEGYPDGLKGKDIPLGARILAVVDAYDAMISQRPYREACSPEKAREELQKNAGTQLDPIVVKAFLSIKIV